MNWLNLEKKVVIITGAASGIGKEIASVFAENRAVVIIADINPRGQEVARNLPGKAGHMFIRTDITGAVSVREMVKKVISVYRRIDVLVNNAGINIPRLLVDPKDPGGKYELHEDEFDRMVSVNQKGPFLCAQAVVREMINRKIRGVVVNITSESGMEGSEGQSCYAGTKGALYALTRSWAKELGKYGIRVVGVAPGILEKTELRSLEYEKSLAYTRGISVKALREAYKKVSVPLGRVGTLREVADLVCFLASDRACYITGTTYNISGGKTRA